MAWKINQIVAVPAGGWREEAAKPEKRDFGTDALRPLIVALVAISACPRPGTLCDKSPTVPLRQAPGGGECGGASEQDRSALNYSIILLLVSPNFAIQFVFLHAL